MNLPAFFQRSAQTTATPSASGVVASFVDRGVPVDVEGLAGELGIPVQIDGELPPSISGKLSRDSQTRSGFRITINGGDSLKRRRFTIAHEIGHFVLHRDLIREDVVDSDMYRSALTDDLERQANRFAAEVLLPSRLVKDYYKVDKSLVGLAKKFEVSDAAIRVRLKELGLAP